MSHYSVNGRGDRGAGDAFSLALGEPDGVVLLQLGRALVGPSVIAIVRRSGLVAFRTIAFVGERVGDIAARVAGEPLAVAGPGFQEV